MKLNGVLPGNQGNSRPAIAALPSHPGRPHLNGHTGLAPPSKPVSINRPIGPAHDSQRSQVSSRSSSNHGSQLKASPNSSSNDSQYSGQTSSRNGGHPLKMQPDANGGHSNPMTNWSNGHRGNPLKAKADHGNSTVVAKSSPGLHQNSLSRHNSSVLNVPYR